jgi:hypothetical protein
MLFQFSGTCISRPLPCVSKEIEESPRKDSHLPPDDTKKQPLQPQSSLQPQSPLPKQNGEDGNEHLGVGATEDPVPAPMETMKVAFDDPTVAPSSPAKSDSTQVAGWSSPSGKVKGNSDQDTILALHKDKTAQASGETALVTESPRIPLDSPAAVSTPAANKTVIHTAPVSGHFSSSIRSMTIGQLPAKSQTHLRLKEDERARTEVDVNTVAPLSSGTDSWTGGALGNLEGVANEAGIEVQNNSNSRTDQHSAQSHASNSNVPLNASQRIMTLLPAGLDTGEFETVVGQESSDSGERSPPGSSHEALNVMEDQQAPLWKKDDGALTSLKKSSDDQHLSLVKATGEKNMTTHDSAEIVMPGFDVKTSSVERLKSTPATNGSNEDQTCVVETISDDVCEVNLGSQVNLLVACNNEQLPSSRGSDCADEKLALPSEVASQQAPAVLLPTESGEATPTVPASVMTNRQATSSLRREMQEASLPTASAVSDLHKESVAMETPGGASSSNGAALDTRQSDDQTGTTVEEISNFPRAVFKPEPNPVGLKPAAKKMAHWDDVWGRSPLGGDSDEKVQANYRLKSTSSCESQHVADTKLLAASSLTSESNAGDQISLSHSALAVNQLATDAAAAPLVSAEPLQTTPRDDTKLDTGLLSGAIDGAVIAAPPPTLALTVVRPNIKNGVPTERAKSVVANSEHARSAAAAATSLALPVSSKGEGSFVEKIMGASKKSAAVVLSGKKTPKVGKVPNPKPVPSEVQAEVGASPVTSSQANPVAEPSLAPFTDAQASNTRAVMQTQRSTMKSEVGTVAGPPQSRPSASPNPPLSQLSVEQRLAQHRRSQVQREQEIKQRRAALIAEAKERADAEREKRSSVKMSQELARDIKSKILSSSMMKAKKKAHSTRSRQSSKAESRTKVIDGVTHVRVGGGWVPQNLQSDPLGASTMTRSCSKNKMVASEDQRERSVLMGCGGDSGADGNLQSPLPPLSNSRLVKKAPSGKNEKKKAPVGLVPLRSRSAPTATTLVFGSPMDSLACSKMPSRPAAAKSDSKRQSPAVVKAHCSIGGQSHIAPPFKSRTSRSPSPATASMPSGKENAVHLPKLRR